MNFNKNLIWNSLEFFKNSAIYKNKLEQKYKELQDNHCIFCNIISNNNKTDVYKICIGYTDVSQIDIIQDTYDMIILEDKIPYPKIIDNTVILININSLSS